MNPFDQFDAVSGNPFDQFDENKVGVAEDVAKSGASGAARGLIGLPGAIGDIANLVGSGGDYLREQGYLPPIPKDSVFNTKLPGSQDVIDAASTVVPGLDYKPQTTAGKYARAVAEFVPGAMLGGKATIGSMARNAVKFGAVPGVASEAAGQAFEGSPYEGAARVAGAITGLVGHNVPGRILSPIEQRPELAAKVARLEAEGIPLTAGQKTGNQALRWIEATAADMPFSGTSAADINANQSAAMNRALAKRMGHTITDPQGLMTDTEWKAAKDALGQRYQQLNGQSVMRYDPQLQAAVDSAVADYNAITAPNARAGAIEKWAQDITNLPTTNNGVLSGDTYQSWRSDIAGQARKSGPGSKEEIALKDLNRALDDAINRSTSPALAPIRAELNRDYSNYKALQEAAKGASVGAARDYIPTNLVRTNAAKRTADYLQGKSDIGRIAKDAKAVMEPLPNSGTAQRTAAMNLFSGGLGVSGALAGGVPGFLAAYVAPSAAARAILSRPGQAYLSNQLARRTGMISKATKRQKLMGLLGSVEAMNE
jgi:hypothetical protein